MIIEQTHSFLEAPIRKLFCNHHIDWEEIAHIATVAYNVFPHCSAGEASFYLMFGCDPFMPTLLKVLLPKLRYMAEEKCRIHLDAKWVLNLKMARDKCPPLVRDPNKTNFRRGDMVLM